MWSAIEHLLESGCVIRAERSDIAVYSPPGVVHSGKKLHTIFDLRFVNTNIAKFKFNLEDLNTVKMLCFLCNTSCIADVCVTVENCTSGVQRTKQQDASQVEFLTSHLT